MAGDWIPIRHNLREVDEVLGLAERTGLDRDLIVGLLARVWSWADAETTDGRFTCANCAHLDAHVSHVGFAQALIEVGWLEIDVSNSGALIFPRFGDWMGKSAKRRLKHAKDQRAKRAHDVRNAAHRMGTTEQNSTENITPPTPPRGDEVQLPDVSELETALSEALGTPATDPEKRRRARTVDQLQRLEATPADVATRVACHRRNWPGKTVTDASLVRHWTACGRGPEKRPGDLEDGT